MLSKRARKTCHHLMSVGALRRPAPGRPHRRAVAGLEPEVLAQAALFTIAGGAWSPAVAATGRTVGGGRGLSEGRAGKHGDQRESSDKRFHDASPCYGRSS